MVQVQRKRSKKRFRSAPSAILVTVLVVAIVALCTIGYDDNNNEQEKRLEAANIANEAIDENKNNASAQKPSGETDQNESTSTSTSAVKEIKEELHTKDHAHACSYKSLKDLQSYERYPKASKEADGNDRRHMVDPPSGGNVSLVCCDTTVGPMTIAVRHVWAPLGARNFLDMVQDEYFSTRVAFMRCVKNFLCQFGIAGDPAMTKKHRNSIQDDPNWLPEGPKHKTNEFGVKRFPRGYFAYAGSGKNSRGNQLIVALKDNPRLGGGSPWEVPFGEVVGAESYETLGKISTTYGDKGPGQGLLSREGSSENVAKNFPELDYMTSCIVIDEEIIEHR